MTKGIKINAIKIVLSNGNMLILMSDNDSGFFFVEMTAKSVEKIK